MDPRPTTGVDAEGNSWAIRVLTAGLGLAIVALGFGSWHTLSRMRTAAAKTEALETRSVALLQAENKRLAPPTMPAVPPTRTPETADSKPTLGVRRVEALNFLTDLARRGFFATPSPSMLLRQISRADSPNIKRVPQPAYMIDANGNFGPGFGEFFGLTAIEDATLQAGLAAWKEEMERGIQARTTVRRQDDGSAVLEVNPVDGGTAMRERFTALLSEGLGPERFRLFKDLNSGPRPMGEGALPASVTGNMNFFGEATAMYTVKRTPTSLSVNHNVKTPNGSASGGGTSALAKSPEATREQLIKTYGPVMKLFPVDF